MRITMNIEDDRGAAPEVKVETTNTAFAQTANHGDLIDAGPPAVDQASLTDELDQADDHDDAGFDAGNLNTMSNGAQADDINDGGAAPTSVDDDSDDSLLH
ncbi:MAG: hypothetical protein ACR2QF_03935 [Geminicoccaceae bacterium]